MQTIVTKPNAEQSPSVEPHRLPEQPRAPSSERFSKRVLHTETIRRFVEENGPSILRKARIFCKGDSHAAEEITQELYPRMIRVAENSPDGILHQPWGVAQRILARLAIDHFRKEKRIRKHIKRLEFPDSIPVPDEHREIANEDCEMLTKALHTLPPRLKVVVVGIFLEGVKAKDIAKRLNLSESRLAELKAAAIEKLREVLGHDF